MSAYDVTTAQPKANREDRGWMFAITLLYLVPMTLFRGWMLSVMWNWFIPNIFPSMPTLSIGKAIGLALVILTFVPRSRQVEDKTLDPWVRFTSGLLAPIFGGLMLLAVGAIVHAIVF